MGTESNSALTITAYLSARVLKSLISEINFLTKDGLQWFSDNLFIDNIEIRIGIKLFSTDRNLHIFSLIQQGSILSDRKLYNQIQDVLKS